MVDETVKSQTITDYTSSWGLYDRWCRLASLHPLQRQSFVQYLVALKRDRAGHGVACLARAAVGHMYIKHDISPLSEDVLINKMVKSFIKQKKLRGSRDPETGRVHLG